jgi:hypothetical protein
MCPGNNLITGIFLSCCSYLFISWSNILVGIYKKGTPAVLVANSHPATSASFKKNDK